VICSAREQNKIRQNESSHLILETLGILGIILSTFVIDSFTQSELTAVSAPDLESNAISSLSLGDPFLVEQGKIIGQRVLAVTPQPRIEFSFMANATINNGDDTEIMQ
jgi:hypothetical protein